MENNYLEHHGILGQKWGIRRYQNADGSLTPEGRERKMYRDRTVRAGKTKSDVDRIISTMTSDEKDKLAIDEEGYLSYEQGSSVCKRILKKHGDTPVAFFDVLDDGDTFQLAIGTRSGKEFRGKGYASKAANEGVAWMNKNYSKYGKKKAVWGVRVDNEASIRIAEKNGFKLDKNSYSDDGKWVNYEKRFKHSEGGLRMTYDELVHTLFTEEPPEDDHLEHHGILGQKWGIRRYQNADGSLTPEGRERYQKGLAKELQETFKKHGPLAPISSNIKNLAEGNKVYGRYVEAFAATDNFLKSRRERLKADKEYAKAYAKPYFERERDLAQELANSQEALDKMISVIDQDERSASWVNDSHLADEVIFFNEGDEYNKLWKEEAQAYGDWREEQNRIAKEALGKYGDVKLRSTWDGKKYEQTAQDFLSFALGLADVDPSINNDMDYRKILGHSLDSDDHLEHHGILGQKWGKKNGPPYPLDENDHSAAEKKLNKFTPSGVVAKYKDHKKKVQRQKALKKARATKAANAAAKKAAEEHEAAKQKALRSADAKEIMKYRDELTDTEMRDAVARIGWDETLRKKVKEQNPDAIDKAMKVIDKYSGYANTVGNATGNLSKIYNNVAKAMNAFTDSEWPIIGDSKPTENDIVKDAEAVKQAILKTKNDTEQYRQNQERTKQEQEKTEQESEKTAQERYKTAQEKARSEQQENTADDKQETTTETKNEKQEKEEKHDWTVDDKSDARSSSTSSASKKETVIDAEFKDVTPERAEEAGRLAVERYLQLEDKRKG